MFARWPPPSANLAPRLKKLAKAKGRGKGKGKGKGKKKKKTGKADDQKFQNAPWQFVAPESTVALKSSTCQGS